MLNPATVQLVNAAINTDPLGLDIDERDVELSLKEREDVKHIRITNSDTIRESYDFGKVLGRGRFGTVLEIKQRENQKIWAIKMINKSQAKKKITALKREIQILKMVQHPHIIFLHSIFESAKKIYLILEKCNGELGKLFKDKGRFTEDETKEVIRQLASAVEYLHKHEIVHRDLKLENILLAQNPTNPQDDLYIKVTDFGLGIIRGHVQEMFTERCGTLMYISPEIFRSRSYSNLCDVWALGIIMHLLLVGRFPFDSKNESSLIELVCTFEPNYTNIDATMEAKDLLSRILVKDPANRITAAEIAMHPWLSGTSLSGSKLENVLDMMKMWRSDMMLPVGSDCDWAAAQPEKPGISETPSPRLSKSGRTPLKIPVKNIEFGRKERAGKNAAAAIGERHAQYPQSRRSSGAKRAANLDRTPSVRKDGSPCPVAETTTEPPSRRTSRSRAERL